MVQIFLFCFHLCKKRRLLQNISWHFKWRRVDECSVPVIKARWYIRTGPFGSHPFFQGVYYRWNVVFVPYLEEKRKLIKIDIEKGHLMYNSETKKAILFYILLTKSLFIWLSVAFWKISPYTLCLCNKFASFTGSGCVSLLEFVSLLLPVFSLSSSNIQSGFCIGNMSGS